MRILAAQLNPTVGDLEGNTRKILQSIEHARAKKADLVLFAELALCGYPPEDLLMYPAFVDAQEKYLEQIQRASKGIIVVVGLVRHNREKGEKPIFNSAAIIEDGKLLGFVDKRLLPTYDVFDERRYFEPGQSTPVWELKGKKVAVTICEDIWQHAKLVGYTDYREDPVLDLKPKKIDLLLNLSASPYMFDKPELRARVCIASAKTLRCPTIMCCQVGGNDQLVFDGYSLFLDADAEVRQAAKGFEEDEMLIDLSAPPPKKPILFNPLEDLYKALVLGLRDYMHKEGFTKACLGLSGGMDSALVACIAVDALGKENVLGLSMPSRFSSKGSVTDAEKLAQNLGIELISIPIEKPYQTYLDLLEPFFQGKAFDTTEENLQARARGMVLMAISNKLGYIVLSTGDKSEIGVGYCTLYGDMSGGLSVISDVTKEQVYALARWINRKEEVIPRSTIEKPPSPELRPDQKASDTLPAYEVIDKVLAGYVEEFLTPEEIAKKHNIPLPLVKDLVRRIHRAEYKRRQGAPGIRVTKRSFLVGRRFPIVQKWV